MTEHEIAAVRATFAVLAVNADGTASVFYRHLFRLIPHARPLFKGDMHKQGTMFMDMLAFAVNTLDRLDAVTYVLQDMARRHKSYGVAVDDFGAAGQAMELTLEDCLGTGFTHEVRSAWAKTFTAVTATMTKAYSN